MSTPANELIENINTYLANPARLQQSVLDFTRQATDGQYTFVDPTNPVVFTIESAVLVNGGAIIKYNSFLRKQYPTLAQTWDDLFMHMSDKDYLNRFAVPVKTKFSLMFRKSEILSKVVFDPDAGYSKLVIPRNSYFTVGGVTFCIEYPIEIRLLSHGELKAVYNTDKPSPIQELSTNIVDMVEVQAMEDEVFVRYIELTFDVIQLTAKSRVYDLNSVSRFSTKINLTDQYYFTRVYIKNDQDEWVEIYTTHSDVVYDINRMTAVLKVTDNEVEVSIPEIYTVDASSNSKIRIDTYETLGPVTMLLGEYAASSYSATWYALDEKEINQFVAPLETLETQVAFSRSTVSGGKDGLTFVQMRDRLINNAVGTPFIPVSNVQIESALEDENYEIIKNIDNITNRTFLASRNLPKPSNDKLITAANASIQTGLFSMEEAVQVSTVIDNNKSITITPNTIFQNRNGRITLVPTATMSYVMTLPPDQRAIYLNARDWFYSPFHYVLDASREEFEVRPYYLDNPVIESKVFVAENDTTLLQASVGSYRIFKSTTGYKVQIETFSSEAFKELDDDEVYVQMRFKSYRETEYAYQNGVFIGMSSNNERVYEFDLSSTYNVDHNNNIELTKFFMYNTDPKILRSALFEEFDILFATSRAMDVQYQPDEVDAALGAFLLPSVIAGITHERLRIRFGYYLERLWARSRTVVSEAAYSRYTTDVPALYAENVYEVDPVTGSTIQIINGEPVQVLLHAAGDPIIINGEPQYIARKGDPIYDEDGNPIIDNPRKLFRQVDYMLIEGAYWFATDSVAISYRTEMTNIFVDWIINSLTEIQRKLIEQTYIYFYPKTTTGNIDVMVKDGVTTTINAGQQFFLTAHVSETVYTNHELRDQLKRSSIATLSEELDNSVISLSKITRHLTEVYDNDVIDINVEGLGGSNNYTAITILHETDRPSIRKLVKAQPDGSLIVEEAVEMLFVKHEIPES